LPPKPFFSLLNAKVEVLLVSLHADPLRDLAPPPPPPNLAELATEALLLAKGEAFAGEGVAAEEDAAAAAFSACAFAASLQFMVSACPFSPVKSDAVELLELFELTEPLTLPELPPPPLAVLALEPTLRLLPRGPPPPRAASSSAASPLSSSPS
jgi:hypothetical protein